jgi:uncharacterized coiled-coil protein SlyX
VRLATVEERVAYLEGQMSEQSHALLEVRDAIRDLDRRIDTFDDKLSRQFFWLVGIQVTTLVAIVGSLLARS